MVPDREKTDNVIEEKTKRERYLSEVPLLGFLSWGKTHTQTRYLLKFCIFFLLLLLLKTIDIRPVHSSPCCILSFVFLSVFFQSGRKKWGKISTEIFRYRPDGRFRQNPSRGIRCEHQLHSHNAPFGGRNSSSLQRFLGRRLSRHRQIACRR